MGDGTGYNDFIMSIGEDTHGTIGEIYPIAMLCSLLNASSHLSTFEGENLKLDCIAWL